MFQIIAVKTTLCQQQVPPICVIVPPDTTALNAATLTLVPAPHVTTKASVPTPRRQLMATSACVRWGSLGETAPALILAHLRHARITAVAPTSVIYITRVTVVLAITGKINGRNDASTRITHIAHRRVNWGGGELG